MYSTCLFCHGALGANVAVDTFPVGRRLAFDAAKGRLWVVCPRCAQWNLTPLEERWEAVEQCERLFASARMRASTAQIGIARSPSGLDLIRIGRPLRPEFVAWRYGRTLQRRRAVWRVGGAVAATALVGGVAGGMASGLAGAFMVVPPLVMVGVTIRRMQTRGAIGAALRQAGVAPGLLDGTGGSEWFHSPDGPRVSFARDGGPDGWRLHIENNGMLGNVAGSAAYLTMGLLLPTLNAFGASRRETDEAVAKLDANGDPRAHFATIVGNACKAGHAYAPLTFLPSTIRLSLEMAAHEETERRALEGELETLANQWRVAEEIAGIADNLLSPAAHDAFVERHRVDRG